MIETILGIILVVLAALIIVSVLLQSGKDSQMTGVITGSTETFLGKDRSSRLDKVLNKITPILSGVFALICLIMYVWVIK